MNHLFSVVLVETISDCNRNCWFCKYGQKRYMEQRTERNEIMDWQKINRILDNLRKLQFSGRLTWNRINEPLLDDRLPEIFALSRRMLPHAHLSIITNGDMLNQEVADRLYRSGLNHLTITAYDDTVIKKVAKLSLASFNIKDRRGHYSGWDNRGGNISQLRGPSLARLSCARPATAINIMPSGKIVLCCSDIYGDIVLGDHADAPLEDVWFSSPFHYYREHLRSGRIGLPLCNECNYAGKGHGIHGN